LARRVDGVVVLTADLADEMARLGTTAPVWVIANFRDPRRFQHLDNASAQRELRSRLNIDDNHPIIGLVGHLIEQKQPQHALAVLSELHAAGLATELVVAGDGPLRPQLVTTAHNLGVSESVHFLGHVDDVGPILAGLDLLVLTSSEEGVPGVLIEAQMCGCPVVTYGVGGVSTVVRSGIDGIIVERPDPTVLATEVAGLLRDRSAREAMARQSRTNSVAFSIDIARTAYAQCLGAVSSST
jgi:glycosyltransferase involved in cell wall biosynthesis